MLQRDLLHRWQHHWAFAPPWSLPPKACSGWNKFNFGFATAFSLELNTKKQERALQGQKRKPESGEGSASKRPREDFFSPQVHQVDKELQEKFDEALIEHITETCTSFLQYGIDRFIISNILVPISNCWLSGFGSSTWHFFSTNIICDISEKIWALWWQP